MHGLAQRLALRDLPELRRHIPREYWRAVAVTDLGEWASGAHPPLDGVLATD